MIPIPQYAFMARCSVKTQGQFYPIIIIIIIIIIVVVVVVSGRSYCRRAFPSINTCPLSIIMRTTAVLMIHICKYSLMESVFRNKCNNKQMSGKL
jgi:hypothetical protein